MKKKQSLIVKISAFALLLLTAVSCIFTYAWFVDDESATGTITFGMTDIDIAYANWTGEKVLADDNMFNTGVPTDLKVKLAADSDPVYLVVVPQITWTMTIPAAAADDGITEEKANMAMSDLKATMKSNLTGFGVSGTHNFNATQAVIVDDLPATASIYTGAGDTPVLFTSTTEIVVFDVAKMKLPSTAKQARTLETDSTSGDKYIVQDWCTINVSIKLYAIQNRNFSAIPDAPTAKEVCNAVGITPTLEELTWTQLDLIGKNGNLHEYFNVGDEKTTTMSGQTITLVVLGFNHDELQGGGTAGVTFGMKDLLSSTYNMNSGETSAGGWHSSDMRTSRMVSFFNGLPTDLKNVIQTVEKRATAGSTSTNIVFSSDKLFLFSEVEIDGTTAANYKEEGAQYQYWKTIKDGNVAANRIKKLSNGTGSVQHWYVRTPYLSQNNRFYGIDAASGAFAPISPQQSHGVSFGFCIGKSEKMESMSWSKIAAIADAGDAEEYFNVGDAKSVTLTTGEKISLVVLGFNHDDLTDGGKAAITFGMKNLLATTYKMNDTSTNSGGWHGSVMRTTNMQTLYNQLPTELQAIIKNVDKKASAGNQSTTITTSSDKLFLFSEVEIDGTTSTTYKDEGIQYDYWKVVKDGKVAANRIKKLSNGEGNTQHWWLRTPVVSNSTNFSTFYSSGSLSNVSASNSYGVSFGFCI